MTASRVLALLGLFPGLAAQGGVQRSGRLAWDAAARWSMDLEGDTALFLYGTRGEEARHSGLQVEADTRLTAVRLALSRPWPARTVLVWHLSLLRLLPFLRVGGARVVAFLHGIESWRKPDLLTRTSLRQVSVYFSNSAHTWQRFLRYCPSADSTPCRIVPLGTGEKLSADEPPREGPPCVAMIGRLQKGEDYKGHREMIAAWPRVLEKRPDAELWIAGDGDLRQPLQDRVEALGLVNRVRFFGSVTEPEKCEILARCRCLAMPSRGEGFGLVYLEAMRKGRPCLVSTLDAAREVVNPPEAGLAVDPSRIDDVAKAVVHLLSNDRDWSNWSRAARRRYERFYTASHFQERLIGALRAIDSN